jgi:hypothetical protein
MRRHRTTARGVLFLATLGFAVSAAVALAATRVPERGDDDVLNAALIQLTQLG